MKRKLSNNGVKYQIYKLMYEERGGKLKGIKQEIEDEFYTMTILKFPPKIYFLKYSM